MSRESITLDFVGVGAARSGTSWLARCLAEHPDVFIPDVKELHFFDNDTVFDPTLAPLLPHFRSARADQKLGEFTPRYLISRSALERIRVAFPDVRILVCLRDPVERAFSQYCYFRFNLRKEPVERFDDALTGFYREDYLVKSLYHEQLVTLFEIFPKERVLVVLFDRIADEPAVLVSEVFRFLEVDPAFTPQTVRRTVNASRRERAAPPSTVARVVRHLTYSKGPASRAVRKFVPDAIDALGHRFSARNGRGRLTPLDEATRARIYDRYFAADLESTEALLGLDLSRWKHPAA
jgi:hypothetical protein